MLTRRQLALGLSIASLIFVTLILDIGMMWLLSEAQHRWQWLNDAISGVLVGQVILIGMYLGLGNGRWYVRTGAAVCLTLAVARSMGIAAMLSEHERKNGDPDFWATISFLFIPMMLAAAFTGLMLRRFRGWQLTWQSSPHELPGRQFQISDVMIWTTLLAMALAAVKFLMMYDEHLSDQFLNLSMLAACITVAVTCGMIAAFVTSRVGRVVLLLSLTLVVETVLFSIPEICRLIQRSSPNLLASSILGEISHRAVFAFAAAIWSAATFGALRCLGCEFIRPAARSEIPAVNS